MRHLCALVAFALLALHAQEMPDPIAAARTFLARWYKHATAMRLPVLAKVTTMLPRHAAGLRDDGAHRVTTAVAANPHGCIPQRQSTARGFRSCARHRVYTRCHFADPKPSPLQCP